MEHFKPPCSPAQFAALEDRLRKELKLWAMDQVDMHDDPVITGIPSGTGGSIMDLGNPIPSKRVLEASAITEDVVGFRIPPAIIDKGGYESAEQFVDKIMSGLKKIVDEEIKIKAPKIKKMKLVTV
ncbi:MAG: hypothetical protein ACR2O7_17245 [Parasphingorhabdus sp.]